MSVTDLEPAPAALRRALEEVMLRDRHRLRRELQRLGRNPSREALEALGERIEASRRRVERRRAALPEPDFPPELPISERRDEIEQAIREHQVVIVCGETGSGKSTQIPKICLGLGRGVRGLIGHTQPRRLAARTIAARIAEELGQPPGRSVGFKVRFSDSTSEHSHIKVMTDGILLAETRQDRFLEAYDTLIIDEAHERSLNIDFLLGYLRNLLPKRPDLKLIITSATIDPDRFSRHFGGAPIIEVSGRTWPVEVRYRPLVSEEESEADREQIQGILDAVDELSRIDSGDILVFLPGERDIRETADALRKHHPPDTDVLPLYARQSAAQQARVFAPHKRRHIVLATNVAETSLTVPGVRHVIDPGTARISRYSARSKVQRLPIEKISRASADQRKGRCGRVAAGVCIRLYSEEDYRSRPEFTDPEIRRTSLASVILQLESLRLGHIDDFPFIDPPDPRQVGDGYKLLEELGAVDRNRQITALGRRLAKLPVDPRLARMLLAGAEHGCLSEALVIISALSIQDPRERPLDRAAAADEAHARFADPRSDFLSLLNLWRFYEEQLRHLSRNQMRKLCRTSFLSHNRMREWRDIYAQLRGMLHDMGFATNAEEAGYEPIHRALLSGLIGQIGMLEEKGEYLGPRGMKFRIFPGSTVAGRPPKWIMAAELAETSRLYARMVAAIEPQWVLAAAPAHLLRRQWFEPHWSKRRGRVQAFERVSLYGLVLEPKRRLDFAAVDAAEARRIFIEAALVRGELQRPPAFLRRNQALIAELQELEHRSRRPDILVDEAALAAFYDERLPPEVNSAETLRQWLQEAGPGADRLLLTRQDLLRGEAGICERAYPPELAAGELRLPLSYRFAPGEEEDGVSVTVPLAALNQLDPAALEWLVPGLLEEKVTALLRALPKAKRARLVPVPETAAAFCREVEPDGRPLTAALGEWLARTRRVETGAADWRCDRLPDHLRMNVRVIDGRGRLLAQGRDLEALQSRLGEQAQRSFRHAAIWELEREGLTSWDFGPLPQQVTGRSGGAELTGYPALVDEEDSVALRVVDTAAEAHHLTHAGLRRLFMLGLAKRFAWLRRNLPGFERLALFYRELGGKEELREEILSAVAERAFMQDFEAIRDGEAFRARLERGRGELVGIANDLCGLLLRVLEPFHELHGELYGSLPPALLAAATDLQEQLWHLVYAGFVSATPPTRLEELPRYLRGMRVRLEKLRRDPGRDAARQRELEPYWRRYVERIEALEAEGWLLTDEPELETYRWLLEEYRIQLFAQELGTKMPVSPRRLEQQWQAVEAAA